MAEEIRSFQVTIPASTLKSANFTSPLTMPDRVVDVVSVRIPPGPRGEAGFALGSSGVQVIPFQQGTFIVTDDERLSWPLTNFWDSGAWTFFGYNTGAFPHTFEITFLLTTPQHSQPAVQEVIPPGQLGPPSPPAPPGGPPAPPPPPGPPPSPPPPPVPPSPPPPPAPPPLPVPLPPIPPSIPAPGQVFEQRQFSRRATQELAAHYADTLHVFSVTLGGQLQIRRSLPGGAWVLESPPWALKLAPRGSLAGALFGGLAHVFAPMQDGTTMHLAQPQAGGDVGTWGAEILS